MQSKGYTAKQTTLFVGLLCTLTSLAAIASVYFNLPIIGLGMAGIVVIGLIATRSFGHVEAGLAGKRLVQFGRNSIQPRQRVARNESDTTRLQGDVKWEKVWQSVVEASEKLGLSKVRLNLHIARHHEDFFASWKSKEHEDSGGTKPTWSIERPIVFDGMNFGRIVAEGYQEGPGSGAQIEFLEFSDELFCQIDSLINGSSLIWNSPSELGATQSTVLK